MKKKKNGKTKERSLKDVPENKTENYEEKKKTYQKNISNAANGDKKNNNPTQE